MWKFSASRGDQVEGEVDEIEGMGNYHRGRVEGATDLTPPSLKSGGLTSGSSQERSY